MNLQQNSFVSRALFIKEIITHLQLKYLVLTFALLKKNLIHVHFLKTSEGATELTHNETFEDNDRSIAM